MVAIAATSRGGFCSGSHDKTVRLWGGAQLGFACLHVIEAHARWVTGVAYLPGNTALQRASIKSTVGEGGALPGEAEAVGGGLVVSCSLDKTVTPTPTALSRTINPNPHRRPQYGGKRTGLWFGPWKGHTLMACSVSLGWMTGGHLTLFHPI